MNKTKEIYFLGDSITEAKPGVSYVDIVAKSISESCVNLGKGGDTVRSLLKRVKKYSNVQYADKIVLFVGVNDQYGYLTPFYKVLKFITRQSPNGNINEFTKHYKCLIEYLSDKKDKEIIIIPPLLMGEDINNVWNNKLRDYKQTIIDITKDMDNCVVLNTREQFIEELKGKQVSNYLPYKILELKHDLDTLKTTELIDDKSKSRGLFLTLDGVHLNSHGANIIAKSIINHLNKSN